MSSVTWAEDFKDAERLDTISIAASDDSADPGETVIDLKELQRLDPEDLQDVFRSTPSVQVGSSLPVSQKVYVNGVEETNLSVTIDGARQYNRLFHHSGTNYIDPELLRAVRIDPGVAPADAGPGALGGSISYETKDVSDLLQPGDNFGGALGSRYESNGNTFSNDISVFGRGGGFEALGYIKKASGNNFEDGNGKPVFASKANLKSGLFKLAYLHDSGYRAKVQLESVTDYADRPFRANFAGRHSGDTKNTRKYTLERETYVASIKDETPAGLFNPYATIAHTETEIKTGPDKNQATYLSVNGKLANEFVLDSGTVDAGIDFYDDYSNGFFPGSYVVEEKAKNGGVFVQARLTPIERARLSFGGRYDNQDMKGVNGSKSENDGFSANLSVEFDLASFVTASGGASHVFGGVQLAEAYLMNPDWSYPAGGLEISYAENAFVGLEFHGEGLSSALSGITLGFKLFGTDINDIRDENYRKGPDTVSELESTGYELNGHYDWQSGFARLTYIDIDTEFNGLAGSTDSQYVGTSIGRSISADIVHSFPDLGITLGADLQYYFDLDGNDASSTPTLQKNAFQRYTVANAFLSYTPTFYDNLTLRLSINNMFDETYADRASYGQEWVNTYDTQVLYERGRSFGLSAKLRF